MKKAILICFLLVLAAGPVFSAGRLEQPQAPVADERALASQLLEKDLQALVMFSRMDFDLRIDKGFIPDRAAFLNDTENACISERPQGIDFTLNEVLVSGDKLAVSLHWMKKVVDASGQPLLREGDAHIVYVQRDGVWLIYQVSGDSPFIL